MPLFATCTIANAILALCAPPGALTFSSWVLAQSLCASTRWPAPGWRAGFLVFAAARCTACLSPGAMLAVLRACWPATPQRWCAPCLAPDLARPCSCSCGCATSAAICHGYRAPAYLAGTVGQTVHADHFDGLDRALAARHGSTDAAR